MDRLTLVRKGLRYFSSDALTNGQKLKMQLDYLTTQYKKLDKAYSKAKLGEELQEVGEYLNCMILFFKEKKTLEELNNCKKEYSAKLLGLLLEISDLILVTSYLDSLYNTNHTDTYLKALKEDIKSIDELCEFNEYKILNLISKYTPSFLTEVLEYKVDELYIAKQLGNGECRDERYKQYECIFHTLYPLRDLISEENYKMIRKWIFVNRYSYLIHSIESRL